MFEVTDRVFVGSQDDCEPGDEARAVVHACKSPCHQGAVGYRGSLPNTHPHYLVFETGHDLFLNIVDPPTPLFMLPTFTSFLGFASAQLERGSRLLIHCNQGESRAPSLALLLLAKRLGALPSSSYDEARSGFERIFTGYRPGSGIQTYLRRHWGEL